MFTDLSPLELRPHLLEKALIHIDFDGWSVKALNAAADDLGVSHQVAELAFPDGPLDMISQHLRDADKNLEIAIKALPLSDMKIRDKITEAVKIRLQQADAHKGAVSKGIAFLALPANVAVGMKALWDTADTMWRAIGDTSMDHNWYTKRMTLSAVYSAVLTFWLNDTSDNHQETWAFLDRRIEDVMKIEKSKFQLREVMQHAPSLSRFLGRLRYPAS